LLAELDGPEESFLRGQVRVRGDPRLLLGLVDHASQAGLAALIGGLAASVGAGVSAGVAEVSGDPGEAEGGAHEENGEPEVGVDLGADVGEGADGARHDVTPPSPLSAESIWRLDTAVTTRRR